MLGAGALRTIKVSSFSSVSLIKKTRSNPNDASQEESKTQIKPLFLLPPGILFSRLHSVRNGPCLPPFPALTGPGTTGPFTTRVMRNPKRSLG